MEWFLKGGFFMWPILACSVLGLWFGLDRIVHFLLRIPRINRRLDQLCRGEAGADPAPGHLPPLLQRAIDERHIDSDLLDIALEQDLIDAERRLGGLSLVAQVAPMLGFLGTVTGMIKVFQTIADLQGQVNPSLLAGGIWEALITTVAGLIVAIPALVAYLYFSNQVYRWENYLRASVTHVQRQLRRAGVEVD